MVSTVNADWHFQKNDDSVIRLSDLQTLKEDTFLEEYRYQLKEFEGILDGFNNDVHNLEFSAVKLEFSPGEHSTMLQLVNTDNKILNKVITVLSSLCWEIEKLRKEAETKFFSTILFYGEGESTVGFEEYETQLFIGRMMPFFQDLSAFVDRCFAVTKNVLQQMSSLYQSKRHAHKLIDVGSVHFPPIYEYLGRLLTMLITLDEIILHQSTLKEHWSSYKRMIAAVTRNSAKFGASRESLQSLENLVSDLELQLFDGKIFQRCVEQNFDDGVISVSKNGTFAEEFAGNIRNIFSKLESRLGDSYETDPCLVQVMSLYVLHFHIFRSPDKRFFKLLWDTYKKVPAVTLIGSILFFPEKFLSANLPFLANVIDKKIIAPVNVQRQLYLQTRSQALPKEVQIVYLQLVSWMIKLETAIHQMTSSLEELTSCSNLLIQGIVLANNINHLLKLMTSLHVSMKYPMTKTTVLALCRLIEMLKAIQCVYNHHSFFISLAANHIFQHFSFQVLSAIATAKKRMTPSDGKYNEQKLDVLSALLIAENVLHGPGTKERRIIAYVAMCMGTRLKCFRDDELNQFYSLMRKMDSICSLNSRVQKATDCSFLYWHRVILPIYWADIFENPSFAAKSQYMASALQDSMISIHTTKHFSTPEVLVSIVADEVSLEFEKHILEPLCQKIETDLRLSIHVHLQLDERNPFIVGFKDFLSLLRSRPIKLFDKLVNIKGFVEHYLATTFYNLTTVALHDWKTYEEMQNLAKQKFCLKSVDAHLPSQTLEQGLDVLEIMRNIHVFVSKYLYNLNNQIFVERLSNNKHLNTINIRHIANSIRTHGIGIMNTTVNFTYQFLRKKFYIFSQFMYDEHIKSRLIKDLRFFKENKLQTDQCYPFERAEKFNKGIRKLGLTADGLSYLDQFRVLISQIGNAMGYVRMIRSGGLHCCGNAIRFIPDLEDILNFEDICKDEGLLTDSSVAAENLDTVISNLSKNFTDSTEYFKLLVDVFAHVFKESKNMHLRNFYVIVPPLTLSFIEHSISSKERMSKKNKSGSAFTDDGFAMGIAYILRLLEQYQEFDSLHWFQSVHRKIRYEQEQVKKQREMASGKDDEKLLQTTTLTIKRLDMFLQEFDLLYYSLSSARIFFSAETKMLEKFTGDE